MTEKVKGIVIKANSKKEKDKNILLFSLEKGKIWLTLKGVKNEKAKMKIASNQFTFGEFILEDGKFGNIVTGFECIENFHELAENVEKYFEASAVLEVVNHFNFSSEDECAKVFVLVLKSLKVICFGKQKSNYALNKFLIELFKISGFPIYSEKCSCCGSVVFDKMYLNYNVGELVCTACKNGVCEELSKTTYLALKILNDISFEKLSTLKLANHSEINLLRILTKNFELRFNSKLNMIGILS